MTYVSTFEQVLNLLFLFAPKPIKRCIAITIQRLYIKKYDEEGTCHIEFTDEKLLKKFNIYAGRQKNWLPPHYGKKAYNEMTDDEKAVIDEFEGEQAYEEVYEHSEQYLIENNELLKLCG